jgi:hypothetical protein
VGSVPEGLFRDLRSTNWDSFQEEREGRLEQGPRMDFKHEAGLGLIISYVQEALLTAYEDNSPLKIGRKGKCSLWWTSDLESLRREVRQFFNKGHRTGTPQSWELYREAHRRYRKEVRMVSRESWRAFCNSIHYLFIQVASGQEREKFSGGNFHCYHHKLNPVLSQSVSCNSTCHIFLSQLTTLQHF